MNKLLIISIFILGGFCALTGMEEERMGKKKSWDLSFGQTRREASELIKKHKQRLIEYCALRDAVREQDYDRCQHILGNGVDPNSPVGLPEPIRYARSVILAKLLFAYGARIPQSLLGDECTSRYFPADLIQFYVQKGIRIKAPLYKLAQIPFYNMPSSLDPKHEFSVEYNNAGSKLFIIPTMESYDDLKLRIAKARIFLENGIDMYWQHPATGKTALHWAAEHHDIMFCKSLVIYETVRQKEFLTFLLCLKQKHPTFYAQKGLLTSLWRSWTPKKLLAMKDAQGISAYQYCSRFWKATWLKPE